MTLAPNALQVRRLIDEETWALPRSWLEEQPSALAEPGPCTSEALRSSASANTRLDCSLP